MFTRRFLPADLLVPATRAKAKTKVGTMAPNLPYPPYIPSSNDRITFMTYNILSPSYMWPQVYTYVPELYKDWRYRHKLLEAELLRIYRTDILCLQELTERDYLEFWKPMMLKVHSMGSNFIAKSAPKYWHDAPDALDGSGIFYSRDKFEFIHSAGIYLSDFLGVFSREELRSLGSRMLTLTDGNGAAIEETTLLEFLKSKNQVCLFVTLKHKPSGLVFVVINTHLYWKYDEVKLAQCSIIMRQLAKLLDNLKVQRGYTDAQIRVLFAGDLNSTKESLVMNYLRGESVDIRGLNMANPMAKCLNRSVYDDIDENKLFDNTCFSGKLRGIFDYIWYHESDFKMRRILSGIEVSQELDFKGQFGLPNSIHPSDHIPLLVEFLIV